MRGGDGLGLEKEWRECSESGRSSDKDGVVSVCVCVGAPEHKGQRSEAVQAKDVLPPSYSGWWSR